MRRLAEERRFDTKVFCIVNVYFRTFNNKWDHWKATEAANWFETQFGKYYPPNPKYAPAIKYFICNQIERLKLLYVRNGNTKKNSHLILRVKLVGKSLSYVYHTYTIKMNVVATKYIVFVSEKSYLFVNTLYIYQSIETETALKLERKIQRANTKTFLYPILSIAFICLNLYAIYLPKYHFTVKSLIWRVYLRRSRKKNRIK